MTICPDGKTKSDGHLADIVGRSKDTVLTSNVLPSKFPTGKPT